MKVKWFKTRTRKEYIDEGLIKALNEMASILPKENGIAIYHSPSFENIIEPTQFYYLSCKVDLIPDIKSHLDKYLFSRSSQPNPEDYIHHWGDHNALSYEVDEQ